MNVSFRVKGLTVGICLEDKVCELISDSGSGKTLILSTIADGYLKDFGYNYMYVNYVNHEQFLQFPVPKLENLVIALDNFDLYSNKASHVFVAENVSHIILCRHGAIELPSGIQSRPYDIKCEDGTTVNISRRVFK